MPANSEKKSRKSKKKKKSREPERQYPDYFQGQEELDQAILLEYKDGDYASALAMYETALMHGHPGGAFNLGVWFLEGTRPGVKKDCVRARHFFEQAAEDRDADPDNPQSNVVTSYGMGAAQALLGRMHEKGLGGLAVDPKAAWQLYRRAMKDPRLNSADAFIFAGLCYQRGVGTKKDSKKAIAMFKKADKFNGHMYSFVMDKKHRPPVIKVYDPFEDSEEEEETSTAAMINSDKNGSSKSPRVGSGRAGSPKSARGSGSPKSSRKRR